MIHSLWQAVFGLLGFCLAMGTVRYQTGKLGFKRARLANTAPAFTVPTGYDPNAETHKGGRITKVADAAIAQRWMLVTFGVTTASIKINPTSGALPIGVNDDTTDTLNSDLTIPLVIDLLGGGDRTLKVYINSTVTQGDFLISDTTTAGAAMTDPLTANTKVFQIGRALQSGIAGQVIEFMPMPNFAAH